MGGHGINTGNCIGIILNKLLIFIFRWRGAFVDSIFFVTLPEVEMSNQLSWGVGWVGIGVAGSSENKAVLASNFFPIIYSLLLHCEFFLFLARM